MKVPLPPLKMMPLPPPSDETVVKVRPSAVLVKDAAPPPAPDCVSEPAGVDRARVVGIERERRSWS